MNAQIEFMVSSLNETFSPQSVQSNQEPPCAQLLVEVETFTHDSDLSALEADWNELLRECPSSGIFLTWEWISTCWQFFGKGARLLVLKARDPQSKTVVGLFPLMVRNRPFRRCGFFRELSFPGSKQTAPDHLDVIAKTGLEQEVAVAFVEALRKHRLNWDVLILDATASDAAIVDALMKKLPIRAGVQRESTCPYLLLPETWDEYYSGLDRKMRSNLKRRSKKLERESQEAISFHQVSRVEELESAMSDLFRLHQQVRRSHGEAGAFHNQTMQSFHRALAERFLRNGRLRLSFLKAGEKPIAVAYCFRHGDVISFYQTGYDQNWSQYGPGSAIILHAIQNAVEEGAREFDFLRGDHDYKLQWTTLFREDRRIRLAATRKGELSLHLWRLLRNVKQKLINRNLSVPLQGKAKQCR